MSKYTVYVSREWVQYGEVSIDAENETDAEALAYDMLISNDDGIKWLNGGEDIDMERGGLFIQGIESS